MAADAVRAGALGELIFATWRFGGEPGTSAHPHANLIETQCHGLDMLEHLCGPIDSVTAQMTDRTGRGYSTLVAALHFANGAVGSLVGSYDSSYAYPGDPPARAERHRRPGPGRGHGPALHLHAEPAARSAASGRPATSTTPTASSTAPSTSTSTTMLPALRGRPAPTGPRPRRPPRPGPGPRHHRLVRDRHPGRRPHPPSPGRSVGSGWKGRRFTGSWVARPRSPRFTSFIGSVHDGPSALILDGAAGIGKTTLWHAGVTCPRDAGHQVLSSRAAESEARLSFAALGDLLEVVLPELPGPGDARSTPHSSE